MEIYGKHKDLSEPMHKYTYNYAFDSLLTTVSYYAHMCTHIHSHKLVIETLFFRMDKIARMPNAYAYVVHISINNNNKNLSFLTKK